MYAVATHDNLIINVAKYSYILYTIFTELSISSVDEPALKNNPLKKTPPKSYYIIHYHKVQYNKRNKWTKKVQVLCDLRSGFWLFNCQTPGQMMIERSKAKTDW